MARHFSNPYLKTPQSPFENQTLFAAEDYVSKQTEQTTTHHSRLMKPVQNLQDIKFFDRTRAMSAIGNFRQNLLLNQKLQTNKTSTTPHNNLSKFEQVMADFTGQNPRVSPPRMRKSIELESTRDTAQKSLFKKSQSKVSTILHKFRRQFPEHISEMDSQQKKKWMNNYQKNRRCSFPKRLATSGRVTPNSLNQQNIIMSSTSNQNNNKGTRYSRNDKASKTLEQPKIDEKTTLAYQIKSGRTIDNSNYKQKFFRIFQQNIQNSLSFSNEHQHFKTLADNFDNHNSSMEPICQLRQQDEMDSLLEQIRAEQGKNNLKRLLDETCNIHANEAISAHEIFEAEALVRLDSLQFKQKQILKFQKKHIRRDMFPKSDVPEPNSVFSQLKRNLLNLTSK